jgi:hypothetical protein
MATEATGKETVRESRSGSVALRTTDDVNRIEAPVTWKAYLICAFASFGGIFFGYDSGYINGVNASSIFIGLIEGPDATALSSPHSSLIVSILSCGTFFGAIIAGDVADFIGRKWTVIIGCGIYIVGCIIQIITGPGNGDALGVIVAGRLIAGIGVGFESAIVILYMSEIVSSCVCSKQDQKLTTSVPSQSSWCSRRRLSILYHHRYFDRLLRQLCRPQPH